MPRRVGTSRPAMPRPETKESRLRASASSSATPRSIARLTSEKPMMPSSRVSVAGDRVADDHLDVPQLVAQDGVGEGQRHQGERQRRRPSASAWDVEAERPRQAVEERGTAGSRPPAPKAIHCSCRRCSQSPLAGEAPEQERPRRAPRTDAEVDQLQPVERLRARRRSASRRASGRRSAIRSSCRASRTPPADRGTASAGRHAGSPAERRREHQEEMERQRRQQDAARSRRPR